MFGKIGAYLYMKEWIMTSLGNHSSDLALGLVSGFSQDMLDGVTEEREEVRRLPFEEMLSDGLVYW
jgi:hypothetical protein